MPAALPVAALKRAQEVRLAPAAALAVRQARVSRQAQAQAPERDATPAQAVPLAPAVAPAVRRALERARVVQQVPERDATLAEAEAEAEAAPRVRRAAWPAVAPLAASPAVG